MNSEKGSQPPDAIHEQTRRRASHALKRNGGPGRRHAPPPWVRVATWGTWLAATILLVSSLAGYWYHREQLADISAEHLRLRVTGPAQVHPGMANQYALITSAVTGEPVSAQIEFTLSSPDGEHLLMGHKEQTDEEGYLTVTIPDDVPIPSGAELKIVATYNDKVEQIATRLVVEPIGENLQLATDRAVYRPGETVRYRAVALRRLSLGPDDAGPIRFEILDPEEKVVAGSACEGMTRQGVGCGEFRLPPEAVSGTYTLVARSGGRVPVEQRQTFVVRPEAASSAKPADEKSATPDPIEVSFRPEGGNLVAGLENRVYFVARDAAGMPVSLVGHVVDEEGRELAAVETTHAGMGMFNLEPRTGETYRLRIETPAGVTTEPKLPETVSHPRLVLTTGSSLFEPDELLEFNVRSTEDDLPLVAAAYCQGVLVGHQVFESLKGANEVAIDLHPAACGVIRLCVFDYSENPPRLVAERLVYRRPRRQLLVRAEGSQKPLRPGEKAEWSFVVTDETGKPVQAVLGVGVVDATLVAQGPTPTSGLFSHFLLNNALKGDRDLADGGSQLSGVALDLLLGTQGPERLLNSGALNQPKTGRTEKRPDALTAAEPVPPAVFDNLLDLHKRYQESLTSYRTNRTQTLSSLITLSFFGGAGLLLLATMLTLMNVVVGLWLWIPVVVASAVSLSVGVLLISPESLKADSQGELAFVPFYLEPQAPGPETAAAKPARPGQDSPKPFDVRAYQYKNEPKVAGAKTFPKTLYWHPLLQTDEQGRATIQFDVPDAAMSLRLHVDAQGGGRIGAWETRIDLSK